MINLSQLTSKIKIIDIFIDALKEIWPNTHLVYHAIPTDKCKNCIEINTSASHYGCIEIGNSENLFEEDVDLIYNSAAMLGIILKGNEQDIILADEKLHLEKLVKEKINDIEQSEEKFRSVFENSPIGKSITGIDGSLEVNQSFCDILGYSEPELKRIKWQEITDPDDISINTSIVQELLDGKKDKTQFEKRYIHKNGSIIWADVISAIKKDKDNKPDYFITSIQNITERKQFENELIKAKEKAEESDRLKSAFLANMSHEIRTPMNGILGFTSLLEKPNLTEETRDQYLQIIKKSGDRMLNTVNDLITISKIETGQEELHLKEVNSYILVKDIFEFFKPSAESKGLDFIYEHLCTNKHDLIHLDTTKFTSIAHNLIRNAIKFTDKGSIIVTSYKDDKYLTFSVGDTGHGIPKDRQKAIFDRFVQADLTDKNALEGSGLGLSIVKSYVEMMGGKISLDSEMGKGSCFTVKIPIGLTKREPLKQTENIINSSDIKLKKILIAEDDDISYQHLAITLEPYANEILHAIDGEKAVQMAKDNNDLDLIMMDIKMPVMDGYEATKIIREFNKDVIVIAQTAYALSDDRRNVIAKGCNNYISKPINEKELIKLLEKYFA